MSETVATEPTPDTLTTTDARGRVIKVRVMDPGEMLDLLEAAGPSSGNQGYMQYAAVVSSVESIDGMPVPSATSKDRLRANAKLIGNDGIVAATRILFGSSTTNSDPGQDIETAKN